MQDLITVPFLNHDLYIIDHQGEPCVPLRPIVEGMGLAWAGQYDKLKHNAGRWRVMLSITQLPGDTQKREVTCIPLRKLPAYLWSINPKNVKKELRSRLVEYQNRVDDLLWTAWNGTHTTTVTPPIHAATLAACQSALLKSNPVWSRIKAYVAKGLNNAEMGAILKLAPSTIRKHRREMERCGLIEPPADLLIWQQRSALTNLRPGAGGTP
ncbi:phage antirepressor N-terminal domain-containing protein [Magnetococcus sp. PR-3]|uniref:phage antirepressor N-terminal domain-containing protein n=1 Tax=Magnetococcus sp. PR-3 TaxID=3120355 RepID=UPI002FCE25D9